MWADVEDYSDGDVHTIGVVVYDPDSAEMEMFADYYRDYIQEGFPVKFIFSGKIADSEEEKCIYRGSQSRTVQRESFLLPDMQMGLQDVIKTCEKEEIYYALGSNTRKR